MTPLKRVVICMILLAIGLTGQRAIDAMLAIERPALRGTLASLPTELGNWVGHDEEVDPHILKESQADDFVNRVYEDRAHPGRRLWLWINYSREGLNLRHSPEICLPSGGWNKIEAECKVLSIDRPDDRPLPVTRLAYSQGELVQFVGFWYYIFGEGRVERYVRGLPIASRSSHGRTTRGSGLTVEVFCPGENDPDGESLRDFASRLVDAMDPILPENWAQYHIP